MPVDCSHCLPYGLQNEWTPCSRAEGHLCVLNTGDCAWVLLGLYLYMVPL